MSRRCGVSGQRERKRGKERATDRQKATDIQKATEGDSRTVADRSLARSLSLHNVTCVEKVEGMHIGKH